MTSQQELADYIKSVHIDLRLKSREIGAVAAWQEHCKDTQKLEKYARVMQELASVHWKNNNGDNSELSGIFWVIKQIKWYFDNDGNKCFLEKENQLAQKFSVKYAIDESNYINSQHEPIAFLDVGSCYNPFSTFSNLNVTAIDLAPANDLVLKCDFLSVPIGNELIINGHECNQLPINHYQVVLFSLLLEYLPSPEQRFDCCKKACLLLKKGGILIILTPDSKHATANASLLKQWRYALASIGFILLQNEKLKHIRCLLFVKSNSLTIPQKWLALQKTSLSPERSIVIPQDKNPYDNISNNGEEQNVRSEFDNKFVADIFSNLVTDEIFD